MRDGGRRGVRGETRATIKEKDADWRRERRGERRRTIARELPERERDRDRETERANCVSR